MERPVCPNCHGEIAPDHPEGLCAACLLDRTLDGETSQPALDAPAAGDPVRRSLEEKLRGQYRIIRMLGRGGMGSVYLARDLTLDREVAIKVVNTASGSREMYDRFRREAKTAAKLSHPNIVPLHAFGDVEGMPYFVMGYVRGESLAARLAREGRVPEDDALRILSELAQALDHAHRLGVVHRDVKPDNVLLDDETGRALLTDFGVAKATGTGETVTQLGGVLGTPHYMSPEQASGSAAIDGRSDLYSLGVVGYAMLAGRLPFDGASSADVLTRHLTQEPPSLRSFAPEVADSTVRAIERCLAKDPGARWPDGRSLHREIGGAEESRQPDDLEAVRGFGVVALLLLPFVWVAGSGPAAGIGDPDSPKILAIMIAFLALAHLFAIVRLRIEGVSTAVSARALYTEPAWWPLWFPRRLRRPGNVWDRLPLSVRTARWWYAALVLLALYMINWVMRLEGRPPRDADLREMFSVLSAVVAMWIALVVHARYDLGRKGLIGGDAQRVAFGAPPSRAAFWKRPHVAAILAPSVDPERPGRDAPHDLLQSIRRDADDLSGPLRPLGAQAAAAGRQLLASIEDADREIRSLARSIEPGEEARLAEKIGALQDDEHAPLRELLEKQLELIRALEERIEEAEARRIRRIEMLKMLALHLATLRTRATPEAPEVHRLTDEVRGLCDEIARQAGGIERAIPDAAQTVRRP